MSGFLVYWAVSALLILVVMAWAGRQARFEALENKPNSLGLLIDSRERFSLNRLQITMWTLLVLSTFLALLFSNLGTDPEIALNIPSQLLGLMGISATSAVLAAATKNNKNAERPEKIAGGKGFRTATAPDSKAPTHTPSLRQIFLEEEGACGENQLVSVTKFQNLIFTIAIAVVYVALTVQADGKGYPELSQSVLWLVGISHAGYIGGKMPDKP